MIGIDWGTTSFRAFRITRDGTIRDRKAALRGILNVQDGRYADTLREEIGPWLAAGEDHVLLSGMIGSRQGWQEAPYLPCPAGAPKSPRRWSKSSSTGRRSSSCRVSPPTMRPALPR